MNEDSAAEWKWFYEEYSYCTRRFLTLNTNSLKKKKMVFSTDLFLKYFFFNMWLYIVLLVQSAEFTPISAATTILKDMHRE